MSTTDFPEVIEGLAKYATAYCRNNTTGASASDNDTSMKVMDEAGFIALHSDLHSSVPHEYDSVMQSIWQ
jgi:hypothetical protein